MRNERIDEKNSSNFQTSSSGNLLLIFILLSLITGLRRDANLHRSSPISALFSNMQKHCVMPLPRLPAGKNGPETSVRLKMTTRVMGPAESSKRLEAPRSKSSGRRKGALGGLLQNRVRECSRQVEAGRHGPSCNQLP